MDNRMSIVFIGYDGYEDIWDDCINLFQRFWKNCPYKTYWINNEKAKNWDNVNVLNAGKDAEWSRKVQLAIEKCNTPYICLLLEDFFVGDNIDNSEIDSIINLIEKDNIKYYKLANMSRFVKNTDSIYKNKKYLHIIPNSDEYGISLQAAIWNKEFLKNLLGKENYNAWKFEFDRVNEINEKDNSPREGCVFDERNVLNLQHGVLQSQYLPNTIKYFKRKGINLNVERKVMNYFNYYKLVVISKGKYLIPKSMRKYVKKILEKLGMRFVSTTRGK